MTARRSRRGRASPSSSCSACSCRSLGSAGSSGREPPSTRSRPPCGSSPSSTPSTCSTTWTGRRARWRSSSPAGACLLAIITGQAWAAAASAAVCGACLGFLPHNLASPARIFLGDGGSMPLGFVVAVVVANAARGAEASTLGLLGRRPARRDPAARHVSGDRLAPPPRGADLARRPRPPHPPHAHSDRRAPAGWRCCSARVQAMLSALVIVASRQSSVALVYVVLGVRRLRGDGDHGAGEPTVAGAAPAIRRCSDVERRATRRPAVTGRRRSCSSAVAVLGLGAGLSTFWRRLLRHRRLGPDRTGDDGRGGGGDHRAAVHDSRSRSCSRRSERRASVCSRCSAVRGRPALQPTTSEANLWLTYAALLVALRQPPARPARDVGAARRGGRRDRDRRGERARPDARRRCRACCSSAAGSTRRWATSTARDACSRWAAGWRSRSPSAANRCLPALGAAGAVAAGRPDAALPVARGGGRDVRRARGGARRDSRVPGAGCSRWP